MVDSAPPELLGLDPETKRPPETRMKSARDARALVGLAKKEDETRAYLRALCKALWNGNPPFTDAQHKRMGRWTANVNFNGAKAIMDSAKVPYYQIFAGAETYVTCKTSFQPNHPDHEKWNTVTADRYSCMLDRWPEFGFHMGQHQFWMLFEGYAPLNFDKGSSWKFCALESSSVLVPNGSRACLDESLPWVVIRQPYRVHELYDFIANKSSEAAGWNEAAVKRAIMSAAKGSNKETFGHDWEKWETRLKNKEYETSYSDCDIIWCAHILVNEFKASDRNTKGRVSHFIITEADLGAPNTTSDKSPDEFLFKSPNKFERFTDFLVMIFENTGDGTWHSVSGLMMDSFKHLNIINRLRCRTINAAFTSAGIMLQFGAQADKEKMELTQTASATWIPPGAQIQTGNQAGFLDGTLAVDRLLGNDLASNLGQYSPRNLSRDDGRGEMPTKAQIVSIDNKTATLSDGKIALYFGGLDTLYDQSFRRAVKSDDDEAKRFRQECYDRGVPKEALEQMDYIRANRMTGYGSKQARMQSAEMMMQIAGSLPEDGKRNLVDDYITAIEGPDKVGRYNPRIETPDMDDAWAQFENSVMQNGNEVVMFSGQNDVKHLQIHLEFTEVTLEPLQAAVQEGGTDPAALQSAASFIEIMAPHCEAHIQRLEGDPTRKELAKVFDQQLQNIVSFHGKLRGALIQAENEAEQAALEEQNALALGAMDQAKIASVENEISLKQQKTAADIQLKTTKAINADRLKNWVAQQANRRESVKTANQINLERARTSKAA